jgi:hypothetical protein
MSGPNKLDIKRSRTVDYSKKYWWVGVIAVPLLLFVLTRLLPEKKDSGPNSLMYVNNLTLIQTQFLQVMGQPLSDPKLTSLIEQAVQLGERGEYQLSIPLYEQAVAQAPIPALLNNLGVQYVRAQEIELARKRFEQALQQDPNYEAARKNLGFLTAIRLAESAKPQAVASKPENRIDAEQLPATASSPEQEAVPGSSQAPILGDSQLISDKAPSSDINSPSPLDLGQVVKGRLGNSDESGKFHFWLMNFPVGSFKVVLDVRRSDLSNGNIGGAIQWFSTDGEKLDLSCGMNEIDYRWRQTCGFTIKKPFKAVLRYANAFTVSDYWLGVFKSDAPIQAPFFYKPPTVSVMKLGQPITATLDGSQPIERDAWYLLKLRPGDYKLSVEYRRADGTKGNVGGVLNMYGPDGNHNSSGNGANDIDFSSKTVSKLSLADDSSILFRVSASFTKELVSFEIEPTKQL